MPESKWLLNMNLPYEKKFPFAFMQQVFAHCINHQQQVAILKNMHNHLDDKLESVSL
jgi:hypothetical protein